MAGVIAVRALHLGREQALRQHAGERLDHDRQAVALVAAVQLPLAAERQDAAHFAREDRAVHLLRIGTGLSVFVDRPALGHGFFALGVDLHLAQRHHRRGGVKPERNRIGRHAEGQRIGAQHHLPAKRRHHDRAGVGHGKRTQALPCCHQRVVARDAEVRGIAHADDAHARRLCLVNRQAHRRRSAELAHGKMRVHQRGDRRLAHDLRYGLHVHAARGDVLVIVHHALRAVALDGKQVCLHQHVRNRARVRGREALLLKHALHERAQRLFRNDRIHFLFLLCSYFVPYSTRRYSL